MEQDDVLALPCTCTCTWITCTATDTAYIFTNIKEWVSCGSSASSPPPRIFQRKPLQHVGSDRLTQYSLLFISFSNKLVTNNDLIPNNFLSFLWALLTNLQQLHLNKSSEATTYNLGGAVWRNYDVAGREWQLDQGCRVDQAWSRDGTWAAAMETRASNTVAKGWTCGRAKLDWVSRPNGGCALDWAQRHGSMCWVNTNSTYWVNMIFFYP